MTAATIAGRHRPALILFLCVTAGVLASDLVVKHLSFQLVAGVPVELSRAAADDPHFWLRYPHEPITLVPRILSLRLTTNTGAVFGLGKGSQWFFMAVSIVAIGAIVRVFWTSPRRARLLHVCLGLILAGAVGNLYDRLRFHAVRDMFWLFPGVKLPFGWRWPGGDDGLYPWIFNIADAALLVGVVTLVLLMWRSDRPRSEPRTDPR